MKNHLLRLVEGVDLLGLWLGLLSLRILLGWDYFESGLEKFRGNNWFADIQDNFPFPFDLVPPEISWQMATWFELSLIVLTVVAIAAVHWPAAWGSFGELMQGYVFTDNGYGNFKLPVLFIGMLMPLLLLGPGKLSVDAWARRRYGQSAETSPTRECHDRRQLHRGSA